MGTISFAVEPLSSKLVLLSIQFSCRYAMSGTPRTSTIRARSTFCIGVTWGCLSTNWPEISEESLCQRARYILQLRRQFDSVFSHEGEQCLQIDARMNRVGRCDAEGSKSEPYTNRRANLGGFV